jgi:hypothetical protein
MPQVHCLRNRSKFHALEIGGEDSKRKAFVKIVAKSRGTRTGQFRDWSSSEGGCCSD